MLTNYIKITLRNLVRNKVYSIVNISGLVLGLTCSMLVIIYVFHEFSYDTFHKNADHIYRLGRELVTADNEIREPLSSAPSGPVLKNTFPEIQEVVRIARSERTIVRYEDHQFYESHIEYADPTVFDVFTFPMLSGDPDFALKEPYTVILTEETAAKYFDEDDPVGKTLRFNNKEDYLVTGVLANIPDNSHLEFDMLCSMASLYAKNQPRFENWLAFNFKTYLLLNENADPVALETRFPAIIEKHISDALKTEGQTLHFFLHPLKKIHLYSHLEGYSPGRIVQIYFFIVFTISILLIACINFMNLSTARSISRAREVGIRKTLGSGRMGLIRQFLGEALILSFISFCFALLLTKLLLPAFSQLINARITFNLIQEPWLVLSFIGLSLFAGILSGSYPAFYLSRFHPVQILKDTNLSGKGKSRIRSGLVVFQFFTAAIFIFQQFAFGIQLDNLKGLDLGFHKKDVVVLPVMDDEIRKSIPLLKNELENLPDVKNAAATSILPGYYIPRNLKIPEGYTRDQMQLMDDINVNDNFIKTLDIELVLGRNFTKAHPTDQKESILINETAAKTFGWENPLGKRIEYSIGPNEYAKSTVIGVVKDFHLTTPHRVIAPLFISNQKENLNHILIRIEQGREQQAIGQIEETWQRIHPNHPFKYSFLEDNYDRYFKVVGKVLKVFFYFTFLMIFIACLGLFALATYTTENRTKEICIRKVLGATTSGIVLTLNRDILKLVLIAVIAALGFLQIPILDPNTFLAYFAPVKWTLYLKSACIILLIAVGTISWQAIKTALSNPADVLKYE